MKRRYLAGWVAVIAIVVLCGVACKKAATPELSDQDVKSVIKAYIEEISGAHDGQFVFNDPKKGPQKMKFDYIHERVDRHGEHYVSCVDFLDAENNAYDVDFHVAVKEGKPEVASVVIHKEKGQKK